MFIYFWDSTSMGGAKRRGETEDPKWALHWQWRGLNSGTVRIMTWADAGRSSDWATQVPLNPFTFIEIRFMAQIWFILVHTYVHLKIYIVQQYMWVLSINVRWSWLIMLIFYILTPFPATCFLSVVWRWMFISNSGFFFLFFEFASWILKLLVSAYTFRNYVFLMNWSFYLYVFW